MWTHTMSERFNVRFQTIANFYPLALDNFRYQFGIVTSLSSRANLLSPNEHVVGVGKSIVHRIWHGVERPNGRWVLVQHEKIRAVLLFHDSPECNLLGPSQIAQSLAHVESFTTEDVHRFRPVEHARLVCEEHWLGLVLRPNRLELASPPGLQVLEDVLEHLVDHIQRFHIVLVDGHLQVQPRELAEVPARVRVLGAKYRPYFEHAIQVGRYRHLLVQLGTLGEAGRRPEVVGGEDARPALALPGDELGGVDLDEALRVQGLAEELAHGGLDAHDRVVGRSPQIQPPVIQAELLPEAWEWSVRVLAVLHLLLAPSSVLHEERELSVSLRHRMDATDDELCVLDGAAPHLRSRDHPLQVDHALRRERL
mmetsp:Transcript_57387/g.121771  ORF Transcript_57387/g.121771 Transcript_57387/m.121771 type:complete len:367 (-) Transcript_57387:698-1798(-)